MYGQELDIVGYMEPVGIVGYVWSKREELDIVGYVWSRGVGYLVSMEQKRELDIVGYYGAKERSWISWLCMDKREEFHIVGYV